MPFHREDLSFSSWRGTSSINLVILYKSFQGTNWFPRETSRTLIDGHLSLSHSESVTVLDRSFRSVNFILTCPLNFSLPRIIPNQNLQVAVTFFSDFLSRYIKISQHISFGKLKSNTLDASNLDSIFFAVVLTISNGKRINKLSECQKNWQLIHRHKKNITLNCYFEWPARSRR